MSKTKEKPKRVHVFFCETCNDQKEMTPQEMLEHCQTVHGVVRGVKCNKRLNTALDGSDWYQNIYEWEVPGKEGAVKLTEINAGPRKNDGWMG